MVIIMRLAHTRLLIPALLSVILLIGSTSATIICPDIPPGPYIPKSPQEDITQVEAYIEHTTVAPAVPPSSSAVYVTTYVLHLTVTFAAATPPADQAINILVTALQGTPQTETVIGCRSAADPSSTTYTLDLPLEDAEASIAVYAWLGPVTGTDRAPNTDFYQITSLSEAAPNLFYDPEPAPVGGVVIPTSKLEILAPYLALAGLVAALTTVVVAKKRSDI